MVMTDRGWRGAGASLAGARHAALNMPCQDVHRYVPLVAGGALIAVADGAGSAENALAGARLAVDHLVAVLTQSLAQAPADEDAWRSLLKEAFAGAHEALSAQAAAAERPLHSFATTLTCVVLHECWSVAAQIGDGVVVVEESDGNLVTAVQPRRGEYVTDTYFLTMPGFDRYLDIWIARQPIRAVAVSTDGLVRLIMHLPAYTPGAAFFSPLLDRLRHADDDTIRARLAALLGLDRVRAGTDDDTTLVLALRDAPPRDAQPEGPDGSPV